MFLYVRATGTGWYIDIWRCNGDKRVIVYKMNLSERINENFSLICLKIYFHFTFGTLWHWLNVSQRYRMSRVATEDLNRTGCKVQKH